MTEIPTTEEDRLEWLKAHIHKVPEYELPVLGQAMTRLLNGTDPIVVAAQYGQELTLARIGAREARP